MDGFLRFRSVSTVTRAVPRAVVRWSIDGTAVFCGDRPVSTGEKGSGDKDVVVAGESPFAPHASRPSPCDVRYRMTTVAGRRHSRRATHAAAIVLARTGRPTTACPKIRREYTKTEPAVPWYLIGVFFSPISVFLPSRVIGGPPLRSRGRQNTCRSRVKRSNCCVPRLGFRIGEGARRRQDKKIRPSQTVATIFFFVEVFAPCRPCVRRPGPNDRVAWACAGGASRKINKYHFARTRACTGFPVRQRLSRRRKSADDGDDDDKCVRRQHVFRRYFAIGGGGRCPRMTRI